MALAAWALVPTARAKDDKGAVVELMHTILPRARTTRCWIRCTLRVGDPAVISPDVRHRCIPAAGIQEATSGTTCLGESIAAARADQLGRDPRVGADGERRFDAHGYVDRAGQRALGSRRRQGSSIRPARPRPDVFGERRRRDPARQHQQQRARLARGDSAASGRGGVGAESRSICGQGRHRRSQALRAAGGARQSANSRPWRGSALSGSACDLGGPGGRGAPMSARRRARLRANDGSLSGPAASRARRGRPRSAGR